jgi:hypothetical protein
MLRKSIGVFFVSILPLYALQDYRCTKKSLCEVQEYKEVTSIDEAFSKGKTEGDIRLLYINQDNHADGAPTTYGTSIGGQLKYETAKWNHISVAASAFVSQKISGLSGDYSKGELNLDVFGEDGNSFAYMGEAYVDYSYKQFDLRIGRQQLDTPMNDRDDIRMLPNTFEAVMLGYGGIEDFVFVAGYIQRWAGYDSGNDISMFKDIPGGVDTEGNAKKGVILAGVMNESLENIALQAWYYDFDKVAKVAYLDAVYAAEYKSGLSVETGLQLGDYRESSSSGIDGDVYGGILVMGYSSLSLAAAFNGMDTEEGKTIVLGYGGGPYFTSMEEMTIGYMNDAEAYVFSAEVGFEALSISGLSLYYAYGKFNGNDGAGDPQKYEENDIVLSYGFRDNTDLDISYAMVDDKAHSGAEDSGYDRFLIRANYYF